MTPKSIRQIIAAHCGPHRYRRFVESFNRKARDRGRLAFWQQDVIAELSEDHPLLADMTVDDLVPAFRLCHVHLTPLVDFDVPIWRDVSDVYFAPEYETERRDHFPYSPTFALGGPNRDGKSHVTLDQCPECVAAMEAYNERHRDA